MITPEVAPLIKVGGLADVVGALPKALAELGHDVRLVCPRYGPVTPDATWIPYGQGLGAVLGGQDYFCRVWETALPDAPAVKVYFLEHNGFYQRSEVYSGPWGEHADNGERFTFLCRAGLNLCLYLGWIPDVIHCHDWTTGLVPVYLNTTDRAGPLGGVATVMTVHNLQHQGIFPSSLVKFAGLPEDVLRPDCLESMGSANLLKGGIYHATKITTVSPTYAAEIQGPEHGCGLNHVLQFRAADLVGVVNGIDTRTWNPVLDPHLAADFTAENLKGKAACKRALQETAGLVADPEAPLLGVVSRLFAQKGLDLFATALPRLVEDCGAQAFILGTGDAALEAEFARLAQVYPGRVGLHRGFSEPLAHQAMAGADIFVMPSRFEPCGLSQLYAMAYGTPPVVRATGGLVDTVVPYEPERGSAGAIGATGFAFRPPTPEALFDALRTAIETYRDRPSDFLALQVNGMGRDSSWGSSAAVYDDVYRWAVEARGGTV